MAAPCANVKPAEVRGFLLQALGPPALCFAQSSENLLYSQNVISPFLEYSQSQVAPGASYTPIRILLAPSRAIWEFVKDEDSQASFPEILAPWWSLV